MEEAWVVISTVRPECAMQSAMEVLQTACNLAIAVNDNKASYDSLITIQQQFPDRFILEFGQWKQSVEASNYIYGIIRRRSSDNVIAFPIPDDMRLKVGWWDEFCSCCNGLSLRNGIGVISCNDGRTNCNVAGFAGLTAAFCDTYQNGWLLCPEYLHWYLDFEITDVAKREGVFYTCPRAEAYHQMMDHRVSEGTPDFGRDATAWKGRKDIGYSYGYIPDAPWRKDWGVPRPQVVVRPPPPPAPPPPPVVEPPKAPEQVPPIISDMDTIDCNAELYVFCSTKNRSDQARRIIKNIFDTSPDSCFICMSVAGSQGEYEDIRTSIPEESRGRIYIEHNPNSPSFSNAINQMWGRVRVKMPGKNILAIATADDMEFKSKWFTHLIIAYPRDFKSDTDGLMFLLDLRALEMQVPNPGKSGMCVVSAKFCDLYMGGWLVSPYYFCNWIDIEYGEVAERAKKRKVCQDAMVYHLLIDFDTVTESEYYKEGEKLYYERSKAGFPYENAPWRYWK